MWRVSVRPREGQRLRAALHRQVLRPRTALRLDMFLRNALAVVAARGAVKLHIKFLFELFVLCITLLSVIFMISIFDRLIR